MLFQREELEIRIAKQRERIAALTVLAEQDEEVDQVVGMTLGGLTDACRTAYRGVFPESLTAMGVRDKLVQLGFPIDCYKNAMAAIHTVLGRLEANGEIKSTEHGSYQWLGKLGPEHPAMSLIFRAKVNPGASNRLEQYLALNRPTESKPKKK